MGLWIDCIHLAYNSIIATFAGYWVAKTGNTSIEPKGALPVIHRLSKVILVRLRVCISCERFLKCPPSTLRCPRKSLRKLCLPLMLPIFPRLVRYTFPSDFISFPISHCQFSYYHPAEPV